MIGSVRSFWFQGARHLVAPFVAVLIATSTLGAQSRFSYSSGQPLEPAYEGWTPNKDGSFTMYFGYMNTNWLQEFDIPVGAENTFSPGTADQGQPTHFYPRRNPFLFTVKVPKDFGTAELAWSLPTGDARALSLKNDYLITGRSFHGSGVKTAACQRSAAFIRRREVDGPLAHRKARQTPDRHDRRRSGHLPPRRTGAFARCGQQPVRRWPWPARQQSRVSSAGVGAGRPRLHLS